MRNKEAVKQEVNKHQQGQHLNQQQESNDSPADDHNSTDTMYSKSTNPFFIFLHEFRQNLLKRTVQTIKPKDVPRIAGEMWRNMSGDDKLSYIVWARKNRSQQNSRLGTAAQETTTNRQKRSDAGSQHLRRKAKPKRRKSPPNRRLKAKPKRRKESTDA